MSVSGEAERLLRAFADAFDLERPSALGPLGQLPDIASEAFARGLVELGREHGLDVDRAELAPAAADATPAACESATIARSASLLFQKDHRAAIRCAVLAERYAPATVNRHPSAFGACCATLGGWARSTGYAYRRPRRRRRPRLAPARRPRRVQAGGRDSGPSADALCETMRVATFPGGDRAPATGLRARS